jgi:hypothetical protein
MSNRNARPQVVSATSTATLQPLDIDFLKGCLQRIDEQRKLQALTGKLLSTSRSRAKRTEAKKLALPAQVS